ncbi:MAG TPA: chitinase, partial [Ktedonobacteraceae bacterium]|nr:chitinase [Ktedonobacteraceae bacterium]
PASVALAAELSSRVGAGRLAAHAGFPSKYFMPYVEVMPDPSLAYKADQIGQIEQQTGIKYFQLAFILGQGCKAVWGGDAVLTMSPDPIMAAIGQVRKAGGDVSITFGGAVAPELGQICPDAASLQQQYQTVIDTYHVTHIDFDLEQAAVADANVDKRNRALAALQKANPGLSISYTLPATPDGLTTDDKNLLTNAVKDGVNVSIVNIMAMDYYGGAKSLEEGDNAISAAKAAESQLPQLGLSAKLGVTVMIGRNDDPAEVFTIDDVHKLVDFAKQDPNIAELSMWALNRDRSCDGQFSALYDCSFATQQPLDFAKAFSKFPSGAQAAPPPPEGPQPPGGPPPPGGSQPTPSPQPDWVFPCSDIPSATGGGSRPDEKTINQDWLSGDVPVATQNTTFSGGGRLFYTYSNDTEDLPQIKGLFGIMQVLGFSLITPILLLIGYQFMLGASMFRYAGALEGLSRVVLGALAVGVSFELVHMLVSFENTLAAGILVLHNEHPFPKTIINGTLVPYRLAGDPPTSYRGIVMPMSRWGCAINDFLGIVSVSFVTNTLGSIIPLIGGLAHLAGHVTNMSDLIRRSCEMLLAVLSYVLWVQVFLRIILLNYYLLMAPLAFGCWALPGGIGQNVVRLWCKGFFTVLFMQIVQLFMLSTLPLLMPSMPQIASDGLGIMKGLLLQFPLILSLSVALLVPRILGASAAKAFGMAGAVAGGVSVSIGTAVSQRG